MFELFYAIKTSMITLTLSEHRKLTVDAVNAWTVFTTEYDRQVEENRRRRRKQNQ